MITKKAKYALKALSVLAKNYEAKSPLTLGDIAAEDNLPKKFLETILHDLRRAEILGSTQGKNGGYYLNTKTKIRLGAEILSGEDISQANTYIILLFRSMVLRGNLWET